MTERKRKTSSPEEECEPSPSPRRDVADYDEAEKRKPRKKYRKSLLAQTSEIPYHPSRASVATPRQQEMQVDDDEEIDPPFTPPPKTKKDKGKQKEQVLMDEPENQDDSDDEEIEFNFKVLGINNEATVGKAEQGKTFTLVSTFDKDPYIYHKDHMAPFRGIIAEWSGQPEVAGAEVSDLFKKNTKLKLLAAATGREFTVESKRAIIFAVEKLTGAKPKEVEPIRKSAWAVVTINDRAGVKLLLKQKAVYDPLKRMLITFRKPTTEVQDERVFEVRNIKVAKELDSVRGTLVEDEKVEMIEEVPPPGEWTTVFDGRVVWKVKAPHPSWQIPNRVLTCNGNYVYLTNSPTCDTCHSDDHHFSCCPWKSILPDVKFRRNAPSQRV